MAGRQAGTKRILGDVDNWVRHNATLDQIAQQAEFARREAARRVAQLRQSLSAPPAATHRLAGAATPRPIRAAPAHADRGSAPSPRRVVLDQLLAGGRGAQDAFTLGLGDRAYAGGRALIDAANGADLGEAWRKRSATERARDEYDRQHFRTARAAGQVAGTVAGVAALGPLEAELAGGTRMAVATPMTLREGLALVGGGGGGAGVATQAVNDLQRGRRSSFQDYAGSALGGAVTALAAVRGRPGLASALGGATTSTSQDYLNGRPISVEEAGRSAMTGALVAAPLGLVGRAWSNGLTIAQKGKLGEALGRARTRLSGDVPLPGQPRLQIDGGPRYTVVDHMTKRGLITEQKFGAGARLSRNQKAARNEYLDRYRVDSFLPRDVGAILAYPFGLIGYQAALDD